MNLNMILLEEAQQQGGGWTGILMIVAMIAIFYFFMIRPQQKQQKKLREQREATQVGDRVVTAGGIHGKVKAIKETTFEVEVSPNVVITMEKSSVTPVVEKKEAAK